MELRRACCYFLATVAVSVGAFPDSVTAQISSDGTLSTTVSTDDAVNFLIEGGELSLNNLFHSFSEFSIPNLGSAYFNNATDITNIFSRVTGGNISNIQGLIRANGTANLFLINPAGIVFGENASLDVGGSFFASTAESVVFGDEIEFSAIEPQEAPLLTINITPGLQMGANSGDITINGTGHEFNGGFPNPATGTSGSSGLKVTSDNTLALIGGNIQATGGVLVAESGKVEIGAIGSDSPGVVNLSVQESVWTFDYSAIDNFSLVRLVDKSLIDISGLNPQGINITAGDIQLETGTILQANNLGNQQAGDININASGDFQLSKLFSDLSEPRILSFAFADGNGSNINLSAQNMNLNDASFIIASTIGTGDSGNVKLTATEDINIIGSTVTGSNGDFFTLVSSNTNALGSTSKTGKGGSVTLNAQNLNLLNGGIINTLTFGLGGHRAGDITINVSDSVSLIGETETFAFGSNIRSSSFGGGNAGNVEINTREILLKDGGLIEAANQSTGASGNVILNTSESVTVEGSYFSSGRLSNVLSEISVGTIRPIEPLQDIFGIGANPNGNAGSLVINSPVVNIADTARVIAVNEGTGDGGEIFITADELNLSDQAVLSTSTESGTGGSLYLNINDIISLRSQSLIDAQSLVTGDGGNINIQTSLVVGLENSRINANAVTGNGGSINITAQGLFLSPDSSITATSEFGIDGVVEINTPDEENKLAIAELPADLTDASQQIVGNCSWTRDNTFYVVGRRGIAKTPQEHIQDYTMWSDIRDFNQAEGSRQEAGGRREKQERIIEANAWIINERGNVELVAVVPSNNQNLGQVASSCSGEVGS